MAEPSWAVYVGMVTGITGAILGIISYRKVNALKSLDLRLELRKAINEIQAGISQLAALIDHANTSRQRVAAATGRFQSGMMQAWQANVEEDKNRLAHLSENAPKAETSYKNLNPDELENKLVEVHRLQVQVNELKEKYEASLRSDDEDRKIIRKDAMSRIESWRGKT